MQDVTDRRHDGRRLELLVGILSLAADETRPTRSSPTRPRTRGDVRRRRGQLRRARDAERLSDPLHDARAKPGVLGRGRVVSADYVERISRGRSSIEESPGSVARARSATQLLVRGVASCVDVPLLRNGERDGVLWFNGARPRKWGEQRSVVLVDVAGQLAIVLANAEAREQRPASSATCATATRSSVRSAARPSASSPSRHFDEARRRADARARSGDRRQRRVRVRERRTRGRCAVRGPARRLGQRNWRTTIDDPRLAHHRPAPHFPRWAEVLGRGDVVACNIRDSRRRARAARARRLAFRAGRSGLRRRQLVGVHRFRRL